MHLFARILISFIICFNSIEKGQLAPTGDLIFVTDISNNNIYTSSLSASGPTSLSVVNIAERMVNAYAIDYDPEQDFIFWTDPGLKTIQTARLNGTDHGILIENTRSRGLAIDLVSRRMFWTDYISDRIDVAYLNGTGRSTVVSNDLVYPDAIVADSLHELLFWTDIHYGRIERANMDGSNRQTVIGTSLRYPSGIAIDPVGYKLYWCDCDLHKLETSDLFGNFREVLLEDYSVSYPWNVAVHAKYLYWTDSLCEYLKRMNRYDSGGSGEQVGYRLGIGITGLHVYVANCNSSGYCQNGGVCIQGANCKCQHGFTGHKCENIDECSLNTDECSDNAVCTDSPGNYICVCNNGYSGNGYFCNDIDECEEIPIYCTRNQSCANTRCSEQAVCSNTDGSYTCQCNDGYTGNGNTCLDINECSSSPCDDMATCTNTDGDYSCKCDNGFDGDGFTCSDKMPKTSTKKTKAGTRRKSNKQNGDQATNGKQTQTSAATGVEINYNMLAKELFALQQALKKDTPQPQDPSSKTNATITPDPTSETVDLVGSSGNNIGHTPEVQGFSDVYIMWITFGIAASMCLLVMVIIIIVRCPKTTLRSTGNVDMSNRPLPNPHEDPNDDIDNEDPNYDTINNVTNEVPVYHTRIEQSRGHQHEVFNDGDDELEILDEVRSSFATSAFVDGYLTCTPIELSVINSAENSASVANYETEVNIQDSRKGLSSELADETPYYLSLHSGGDSRENITII